MWRKLKLWKKPKNKKIKREVKEIPYVSIKKNEYIIIDVRSRNEYLEGHLNGSINIPLADIKKQINNIDKNERILLYCQSGLRSKKAEKILKDLGYKNVYNLKGGLENI